MRLIIFGPPGSGKGTYSAILKKMLGVTPISTGDIFRDAVKKKSSLGMKIADFLKKGELVPDEIVIDVLRKKLNELEKSEGFILDGFPRTLKQAEALANLTEIDAVIQIVVSESIIIDRLSNRRICPNCGAIYNLKNLKPKVDEICDKCGSHLIQREDDKPEIIKVRLQKYRRQTRPIMRYFRGKVPIIKVVSRKPDQDPIVIAERIVKKLRKIGLES